MPLWRYDAAAATDTKWNTRTILGPELIAAATVTADAEILDIVGTPELGREQQFQVVAGGENANLDTDSCWENLLDACEELLSIRVDIVADADIAHPRVLTNLHNVESCAIRARNSSWSS